MFRRTRREASTTPAAASRFGTAGVWTDADTTDTRIAADDAKARRAARDADRAGSLAPLYVGGAR